MFGFGQEKRGAGRPKVAAEMKRVNVYITEESRVFAQKAGLNMSALLEAGITARAQNVFTLEEGKERVLYLLEGIEKIHSQQKIGNLLEVVAQIKQLISSLEGDAVFKRVRI